MTWVAVGVVGGSLVSGLFGASSSKKAAKAQQQAAQLASDTQLKMFNTVNDQQKPYREAGQTSLNALMAGMGYGNPNSQVNFDGQAYLKANPDVAAAGMDPWQHWTTFGQKEGRQFTSHGEFGSLTKPFSAQDLSQWQDPGYQFRLQQGEGALQNSAAGTSGLVSGNSLRSLMDYGQGAASQEYQNAFNRYNTNQTNIYNRLSNIAGLGQTSANASGTFGMNAAGNIGSAQMAGGAAQAAGYIGQSNAISGGINNAVGGYLGSRALSMYQPTATSGGGYGQPIGTA